MAFKLSVSPGSRVIAELPPNSEDLLSVDRLFPDMRFHNQQMARLAALAAQCAPPMHPGRDLADSDRIGPLVAAPMEPGGKGRPLCSFESIVDHIGRLELVPRPEAETRFLERLEAAADVDAYVRRPDKSAVPERPQRGFFEHFKVLSLLDGGVLRAGRPAEVLAWQRAALLVTDAAALFGYGTDTAAPTAAVVPLRLVEDAAQANPAPEDRIKAAAEAIQAPVRTVKGKVSWTNVSTRLAFAHAYAALTEAGAKTEEALQVISDQWGYGNPDSLRKKITPCKKTLETHPATVRAAGARNRPV